MTARKPVAAPKPRNARPLAQPAEPKNPITVEIMQRIRRVISKSGGEIATATIAEDTDISARSLAEWLGCWRSMPSCDNLVSLQRWLAKHDPTFVPEVIEAKKIRFRGEVESIQNRKLSDADVAAIRDAPDEPGTITKLAGKYDVHSTMIRHIRNGLRYPEAQ